MIEQALIDCIFTKLKEINVPVVFFLDDDVEYPFIYIGFSQFIPRITKDFLLGDIFIHIDVWGDFHDRARVSDISDDIIKVLNGISVVNGISLRLDCSSVDVIMKVDDSSGDNLWRNQISCTYKIMGRK
ncbi:MAG: hypothetical protein PUG22_04570 [Peptoniphilaceae bacterium]|nr:hypothetical protein [Peptoniphilaceae bacterium]